MSQFHYKLFRMEDIPDETVEYWTRKKCEYHEKLNTTERRMWRAWGNFKKWKAMIRRLGQKRQGQEHPSSLRQFTAKNELELKLMDMVSHTICIIQYVS